MRTSFFIFLVMLLITLKGALAVDCSDLTNREWCEEILSSDISDEEKAYLLADVISDTKHYPDHSLVRNWNTDISTNTKPDEVRTRNRGYIKNAWVKILAVMPSVLYEDLFIDINGNVLTGFHHEVELPRGRASGDCRTRYYLQQNRGTLRIYVNGVYQGNRNLESYLASLPDGTEIEIKVRYDIYVKTKIKHYKYRYEYRDDGSRRRVCRYDNTEYKTDRLTLRDEVQAIIHNPEYEANFEIKETYEGTTKGEFTFSDAVNAELLFDDSFFKQHNYVFSEVFSLEPLNVLTVKAEQHSSNEQNNLAYVNGEIRTPNAEGCQIELYDFFGKVTLPCDVEFEQPEFSFSVDQTIYKEGEVIKVKIEPRGDYIVEYAEEEYTTREEVELTAEYPDNKITVKAGNTAIL